MVTVGGVCVVGGTVGVSVCASWHGSASPDCFGGGLAACSFCAVVVGGGEVFALDSSSLLKECEPKCVVLGDPARSWCLNGGGCSSQFSSFSLGLGPLDAKNHI